LRRQGNVKAEKTSGKEIKGLVKKNIKKMDWKLILKFVR